jgi:hypothetical protein
MYNRVKPDITLSGFTPNQRLAVIAFVLVMYGAINGVKITSKENLMD